MNFKVELPVIREEYVNIEKCGAVSGGKVSNTAIINKAIRELHENGGGHIIIPKGLWLSGPIELLSGIDLHLERGAVLLFDKNSEEYPVIRTDFEGNIRYRAVSPLTARNAHDVSVTGEGIIDGNGHLWRVVKKFKVTEKEWQKLLKISPYVIPTGEGGMWFPTKSAYEGCLIGEASIDDPDGIEKMTPYYDFLRPVMVDIIGCDKVLLEGVTFSNSPCWNVHPIFTTNLTVKNASIRNPYYAQNGDGIDIESCRCVELDNVKFDVGDDAICVKSGKNAEGRKVSSEPSQDIYIHDCVVYHGHGGFVVGSEMSRGVRNVLVENCTFMGTDTGIRFKSQLGRGGIVEDITIKDIFMTDIIDEAVIFTFGYTLYKLAHEKKENDVFESSEDIPVFRKINMDNIICDNAKTGLKIQGLEISPISDISLNNSFICCENDVDIAYAERINLQNTTINEKTYDYIL